MRKLVLAAVAAFAIAGVAACDGSAERAGEDLDSSIEEASQGEENLGDGAFERAGEAIDEAGGGQANSDVGDALNDATDGDPSTDP